MADLSVAVIVLAAGASTRMRLTKQLLPFKRKNLLQYTIDEASNSKAGSVVLVLGAHAEEIRRSVRAEKALVVLNESWSEGMGASIRTGIKALPPSVEAAIISLCDQPLLTSSVFDALVDAWVSSGKPIVASEYDGSPGVPALFARKYFPELTALQGDTGARRVINAHLEDAVLVPFAGGSIDLDTPEEYSNFILRKFER